MSMLIYCVVAVVFLLLALALYRKSWPNGPSEVSLEKPCAPSFRNGGWLKLSERIFDPADARWLAEELAFPKLAETLTEGRKRLAIEWLEALQSSFDDLVRTPEITPGEGAEANSPGSWRMLWLTGRFKLLVTYALLMVRMFGPYHRLIPSFSWLPSTLEGERSFRTMTLGQSRHPR